MRDYPAPKKKRKTTKEVVRDTETGEFTTLEREASDKKGTVRQTVPIDADEGTKS